MLECCSTETRGGYNCVERECGVGHPPDRTTSSCSIILTSLWLNVWDYPGDWASQRRHCPPGGLPSLCTVHRQWIPWLQRGFDKNFQFFNDLTKTFSEVYERGPKRKVGSSVNMWRPEGHLRQPNWPLGPAPRFWLGPDHLERQRDPDQELQQYLRVSDPLYLDGLNVFTF